MDDSETWVQVCVLDEAGRLLANRRCASDRRRITRFAGRFGPVRRAALESRPGTGIVPHVPQGPPA